MPKSDARVKRFVPKRRLYLTNTSFCGLDIRNVQLSVSPFVLEDHLQGRIYAIRYAIRSMVPNCSIL
jgi:hypothetical protein